MLSAKCSLYYGNYDSTLLHTLVPLGKTRRHQKCPSVPFIKTYKSSIRTTIRTCSRGSLRSGSFSLNSKTSVNEPATWDWKSNHWPKWRREVELPFKSYCGHERGAEAEACPSGSPSPGDPIVENPSNDPEELNLLWSFCSFYTHI